MFSVGYAKYDPWRNFDSAVKTFKSLTTTTSHYWKLQWMYGSQQDILRDQLAVSRATAYLVLMRTKNYLTIQAEKQRIFTVATILTALSTYVDLMGVGN
jgi:hypothetical protein